MSKNALAREELKACFYALPSAKFFEASVSPDPGSLYRFLDAYIASGNNEPLDAIIVDDPRLDKEMMEEE